MTRPDPAALQTVEQQAAQWFALNRSGGAGDGLAFEKWLSAAPEHRAAYDNLQHYWTVAGAVRSDPRVLEMRDEAYRTRRPLRAWAAGAVAASLLAGVLGFGLVRTPDLAPAPMREAAEQAVAPFTGHKTFRTAVGQTTSVILPDGSVVTLDTDTVLRTRLTEGERRLDLEKGRAFFRVAKDASRPFVVHAAGRKVIATGTAFDVRADRRKFEVILVEGRVRVVEPVRRKPFAPPQVMEMAPGSHLVADARSLSVRETDAPKETSWLTGRLTFENDRLADVVAEMNRYSERKIVIEDGAVADAPILGVFKAGDVEGFVKALEDYRLARVVSRTDEAVVLGPM